MNHADDGKHKQQRIRPDDSDTQSGTAIGYRGPVRDHFPPGLPLIRSRVIPATRRPPWTRSSPVSLSTTVSGWPSRRISPTWRSTRHCWRSGCVRGLVVMCEDCREDHYHDWEMLRANLLQLLLDGTVRPHEPAVDPRPDDYVTWDYCRGYADAHSHFIGGTDR